MREEEEGSMEGMIDGNLWYSNPFSFMIFSSFGKEGCVFFLKIPINSPSR